MLREHVKKTDDGVCKMVLEIDGEEFHFVGEFINENRTSVSSDWAAWTTSTYI